MMTGLSGKQLVIVVILIESASALMVFALLASQGRPGLGAALGASIIALPFILIPTVIAILARLSRWTELARLYPEAPGAPEPRSRKVCSMAVRSAFLGFNNCMLSAADENHLHLRMFDAFSMSGMKPVSIPWAAVTELEPAMLGRVKLTVLDGPSLWVPKELVEDELEIRAALENANDDATQPYSSDSISPS